MTTIHFSEFSTLASCERKWAYRYALGSEEKVGNGAYLGTLLHVGTAQWLNGNGVELPRTWRSEEHSDSDAPGELVTHELSDFDPDVVSKAEWLLARYAAHYGSEPPSHWNVISTEQWLTAQTEWGTLAGTADAIVEIDDELWFLERKSYGSKGRLNWVGVDPQLGVYDLLVQSNYGKPAFGIIFDGIYTYRWVPKKRTLADIKDEIPDVTKVRLKGKDLTELAKQIQASEPGIERDTSESFERVPVDLSDAHRATTAQYLAVAVERRATIAREGGTPGQQTAESLLARTLPSIGRQCDYCDFKPRCWNELGGVEPEEIEVEDDGEPV